MVRDDNLITEGSFNWLSAVRTRGGVHQREERTMIVEGAEAKGMIEKEVQQIEATSKVGQAFIKKPVYERRTIKKTKMSGQDIAKWIIFSLFVAVLLFAFLGPIGFIFVLVIALFAAPVVLLSIIRPEMFVGKREDGIRYADALERMGDTEQKSGIDVGHGGRYDADFSIASRFGRQSGFSLDE